MGEFGQNYEKVSRIGSGAYGEVWKARDTLNPNMMVALKRIRSPSDEEGVSTSLLREVSLLIELNRHNNEHIVKLLDVCPGNHNVRGMELYLVFEHVEQDLATYLANAPAQGLSLRQIKSIMNQLLDGIRVIHENRIEHRDLKPQNVLITDSGLVKIADFGLARLYKPNSVQTSVVATLWYRSPEVLLASRDGYASAVDMWGAGCIFGELIRRDPLFQGTSENSQLVKIFEIIGSPQESDWPRGTSLAYASFAGYSEVSFQELFPRLEPEAIDLMKRMLSFNPERRITAKGALAHSYFNTYTPAVEPVLSDTSKTTTTTSQLAATRSCNNQQQPQQLNPHDSHPHLQPIRHQQHQPQEQQQQQPHPSPSSTLVTPRWSTTSSGASNATPALNSFGFDAGGHSSTSALDFF